jgi:hypothetical protein
MTDNVDLVAKLLDEGLTGKKVKKKRKKKPKKKCLCCGCLGFTRVLCCCVATLGAGGERRARRGSRIPGAGAFLLTFSFFFLFFFFLFVFLKKNFSAA